ncbi:MAG: NERD domain-containing protein, partial [Methanobrevibacter sp.]|nr:NERD domain-containing protein [Methanobrevibacter sp.]
MKIVVCQNCGAKYQLDDEDDINAFECSVCSGNLEELERFSNSEEQVSSDYNSQNYSDLVLVYCTNCGLKYQLSENDNINEFECNSCGGTLDYVSTMGSTSSDSTTSSIFIDSPLTENPLADDEIDEIIPIHAEANFADSDLDEIVPIHAETNFV